MFKETITQIRRNHALEHGTVAVLMERGVATPLGGYSTRRGFFILGRASAELVGEAAGEALARIVDGQRQLAISRHCGTNLVTSAVLAGLFHRHPHEKARQGGRSPLADTGRGRGRRGRQHPGQADRQRAAAPLHYPT